MSVLYTRKNGSATRTEKLRQARVDELEKIVKLAKDTGVSLTSLTKLGSTLSKLEIMLLDTAFKGLSLDNADKILLIIPEQYIEMLQNLTIIIAHFLYQL